MTLSIALAAILLIAAMAGLFAFNRAKGLRRGGGRLNSLPVYHAIHAAIWAAAPALCGTRSTRRGSRRLGFPALNFAQRVMIESPQDRRDGMLDV